MNLDELKPGETAIIVSSPTSRWKELGFISGTEIKMIDFSPLGDPIKVIVKGTCWAVRRKDARKIEVKQNRAD